MLKYFSFWVPVLAAVHYVFELIYNPLKDIIFALDPLLGKIFWTLNINGILYDSDHSKILFPGFLLHLLVWFIYGLLMDYVIRVVFRRNQK